MVSSIWVVPCARFSVDRWWIRRELWKVELVVGFLDGSSVPRECSVRLIGAVLGVRKQFVDLGCIGVGIIGFDGLGAAVGYFVLQN